MKLPSQKFKFALACILMLVAISQFAILERNAGIHEQQMKLKARSHELFVVLQKAVDESDLEKYEKLSLEPARKLIPNDGLLEIAIKNRDSKLVKRILEDGVSPSQLTAHPSKTRREFYGGPDMHSSQNLMLLASSIGEVEILNLLHKSGAQVTGQKRLVETYASSQGVEPPQVQYDSPLETAVKNAHIDTIVWLLENGADPNAPVGRGRDTAITLAAKNGHFHIVSLLCL